MNKYYVHSGDIGDEPCCQLAREMVLYDDYLSVTQSWSEIAQDNFDAGRRAERARIRAGVEAMRPRTRAIIFEQEFVPIDMVLAVIDGEQA